MENYIGTIVTTAASWPPPGFMVCRGQLLKPQDHPALFSVIGNRYGGDGTHTFALPSLPQPGDPGQIGQLFLTLICVEGIYPPHT